MKMACCQWCLAPLKMRDTYTRKQMAFCSPHCAHKEWLFQQWQSDETLNKLMHYRKLTGGGNASPFKPRD